MSEYKSALLAFLICTLLFALLIGILGTCSDIERCGRLQKAYPERSFRMTLLRGCELEIGDGVWIGTVDASVTISLLEKEY